ncbi:hypothetical protein IHE44_0012393 [Lamprotornis superbus]|uniref:Testin n=1 Tax=Lamprotornis superbus TaxID=245042 RepID=A0A835TUM4_9PASS|nr:hypothetical protein IHE44_0012393 [Lamprotornis superbus]
MIGGIGFALAFEDPEDSVCTKQLHHRAEGKIEEMYFYSGVCFACKWKNEDIYVDMTETTSVLFTSKLKKTSNGTEDSDTRMKLTCLVVQESPWSEEEKAAEARLNSGLMMGLGHEEGFGAPCLKCKEKCEGFELHYWRKICRNCKCGQEEHDIPSSHEEDRKVGKLFEDTKYTTLIAKLKNDSNPMYKRNVMILTSPVPAKNISIDTVTYEWAPPVQNQTLARQYMQMLPKEKQPVAGSEGAQYRKKQLAKQLPAHDQDPSKCHELSPSEVKHMEQFVKKYKKEALGVGDVKLPGEVEVRASDENNLKNGGGRGTSSAVGTMEKKPPNKKASQYTCQGCHNAIDPEVQRVTYNNFNWHATQECFLCSCCSKCLIGQKFISMEGMLFCSVECGSQLKLKIIKRQPHSIVENSVGYGLQGSGQHLRVLQPLQLFVIRTKELSTYELPCTQGSAFLAGYLCEQTTCVLPPQGRGRCTSHPNPTSRTLDGDRTTETASALTPHWTLAQQGSHRISLQVLLPKRRSLGKGRDAFAQLNIVFTETIVYITKVHALFQQYVDLTGTCPPQLRSLVQQVTNSPFPWQQRLVPVPEPQLGKAARMMQKV